MQKKTWNGSTEEWICERHYTKDEVDKKLDEIEVGGGTGYVHPSSKQCDYEYVHPSTKQCNYSYSHPSSKQCSHSHTVSEVSNASVVEVLVTFTDSSTRTLKLVVQNNG